MAPYGILQSLTREADLAATLQSVARVIKRGGTFAIDLVPDLPAWRQDPEAAVLERAADAGAGRTGLC